jgi:hypothetical protein
VTGLFTISSMIVPFFTQHPLSGAKHLTFVISAEVSR